MKKLATLQEMAEDLISEFHEMNHTKYSANLRALVYGVAAWAIEEFIAQSGEGGEEVEKEGMMLKKKIYIGLALHS